MHVNLPDPAHLELSLGASDMALACSFAAGPASAFVCLAGDNRLNVYDTTSGAQLSQLVPSGHLQKGNSCTTVAVGTLVCAIDTFLFACCVLDFVLVLLLMFHF